MLYRLYSNGGILGEVALLSKGGRALLVAE